MSNIEKYIYNDEFKLIKDDVINNNYDIIKLKWQYFEMLKNTSNFILFEKIKEKMFLCEKLISILWTM